jgi:hypothetical protein
MLIVLGHLSSLQELQILYPQMAQVEELSGILAPQWAQCQ